MNERRFLARFVIEWDLPIALGWTLYEMYEDKLRRGWYWRKESRRKYQLITLTEYAIWGWRIGRTAIWLRSNFYGGWSLSLGWLQVTWINLNEKTRSISIV